MSLSNLHTLQDSLTDLNSEFKQQRFAILKLLEGSVATPYFDKKGIITIGIGFNIDTVSDNRKLVVGAMSLTDIQKANIETAWNSARMAQIKRMPQATDAQLAAKNAELDKFLNDILGAGQSFSMDDPQIKTVFDVLVLDHQNKITSLISTPSLEQIVLTSLHYNTPDLIGPGLQAALAENDPATARAEAWYQIRYAHKDENQARRYMEAALFGLYNDNNNVTVADAKAVYRMFTLHRDKMITYDNAHTAALATANTELDSVPSLRAFDALTTAQALDPAKPLILSDLISQNSSNTQLRDKLTADTNSSTADDHYLSTNIYLDPGRSLPKAGQALGAIDPNYNGGLHSATPDTAVDEIFSGEGGNDYLFGGKGDDILAGGTGLDTYIYRLGDGNDLIADSDGQGRIVIYQADGKTALTVAAGLFTETATGSNTWISADGKLTLKHNTTWMLAIQDGGSIDLGNDFTSGKFDIILKEADTPSTQPIAQPQVPSTSRDINFGSGSADAKLRQFTYTLNVGETPDPAWKWSILGIQENAHDETRTDTNGNPYTVSVVDSYTYTYNQQDDLDNWILDTSQPDATHVDNLNGSSGNDHINSGGGSDIITATQGGDDYIEAGEGNNNVNAGAGNDTILTGSGSDTVHAGEGNNYINAGNGINTITSGDGNDTILTGTGNDTIDAGGGNNYVDAGAGRDIVKANATGLTAGVNPAHAKSILIGGADADILQGGAGDDTLYADSPISVDTAIAQGGNAGNSHNVQGDWLSGGAGNDTLVGSNANDVLTGGLGSDLIIAGAGDDSIFGDIDWTTSTLDWTVTDSNGVRTFSPVDASLTPTDTTGSADVIYAGAGADWVMAGGGNDVVFGEEGNDTLAGNGGNDILMGGAGSDHLYGDGAELVGIPGSNAGSDYLDGVGGAANDSAWRVAA